MQRILKLIGLAAFAFAASILMFRLFRDGFVPLGSFIGAAVIFVAMVVLRKELSPWKWLATGIILAGLFTVYPMVYTVWLSFTNMSGGHLLTREQALDRIESERYVPEDGVRYTWKAYQDNNGNFLLLARSSGGEVIRAEPGKPFVSLTDMAEDPAELDGFARLDKIRTIQNMQALGQTVFGKEPDTMVVGSLESVAVSRAAYRHDDRDDSFTDNRDGTVYLPLKGTWTASDGRTLTPGFMVNIGLTNYDRFVGEEGFRKPIVQILVWNLAFSFFSVTISFALGLMIALAFENLPGKRIIRSLLIIPYPIPVLVSIMVWRALFNEQMGMVTNLLAAVGIDAKFFTDPLWTRTALVIINVYLSYPYFYILSSGALKSIPRDLYEAADIDGANSFHVLKSITLPMVLNILAPMLIASYSFNFNNFTLVWGFNAGLPAMADTIVPMGHTDLLISFIYRLGFNTANAADYGFSAAITVMLFVLVAVMVFLQSLGTRTMKEA